MERVTRSFLILSLRTTTYTGITLGLILDTLVFRDAIFFFIHLDALFIKAPGIRSLNELLLPILINRAHIG